MALIIIETHPVQYHAPVYRYLQQKLSVPVTVIYGSDFSMAGYRDEEFNTRFSWDTDLLGGYTSIFLSRSAQGGADSFEKVSANGLREILADRKPDAILLTGYAGIFHLSAFDLSRKTGCPIIFRGETCDHARRRGAIKSVARDLFLHWLYKRCACLLYIGQRSRDHYIRLGVPTAKLFFSPYCVDQSVFESGEDARTALRQTTRNELKASDSDIVLIFSGKISYRKGIDTMLFAVKKLPADIRERAVIVFLGDGAMKKEAAVIATQQPHIRTVFLGFKNQRELSRYYHASDLLILPSRELETWGLVVNEALCHGLPCVVSDAVGCAPDLISSGITGEIFKANDVSSLTDAIMRALTLIGNPNTRDACREKVSHYSVARAAEGIAQAYNSVTRNKGAG